jgi:hypothetical protein
MGRNSINLIVVKVIKGTINMWKIWHSDEMEKFQINYTNNYN